jgi:hypothetical protein
MTLTDRAEAPEAKRRLEELPGAIPELRTLRVDLDTVGLDGSSDLALVTTHDSVEGLRAYQEHPAHQAFLGWLRPRLQGRAAVDYES